MGCGSQNQTQTNESLSNCDDDCIRLNRNCHEESIRANSEIVITIPIQIQESVARIFNFSKHLNCFYYSPDSIHQVHQVSDQSLIIVPTYSLTYRKDRGLRTTGV